MQSLPQSGAARAQLITAAQRAYRPLRRPWGGWGARQWRAEVAAWLTAALVVLSSWASLNLGVAILDLTAELAR